MEQMDLQPVISIRRALRIARLFAGCEFLAACFALAGAGRTNSLAGLQVLMLYLALMAILLAFAHMLTRRHRKPVALAEMALTSALCGVSTLLAFASVQRATLNGNSIVGVFFSALISVLVLYRIHRFMYPNEPDPEEEWPSGPSMRAPLSILTPPSVSTRPGPRRKLKSGMLATFEVFVWSILVVIAWILVDDPQKPDDYFWMVSGIVACLVVVFVTVPVALLLLSDSQTLWPLQIIAANRRSRRNGRYSSYLIKHGKARWTAAGYALAGVGWAIGFWPLSWLLDKLPLEEWAAKSPWVYLSTSALYAFLVYLVYTSFRKSIQSLAKSIPPGESARVAERGDFALYLRSFADDDFQFDLGSRGWRRFLFLPPAGDVYQRFARSQRLEEFVVKSLWSYGPVVSVASPSGAAELVGALQLRLQPEHWQEDVTRLAERAVSVLMVMGASPGVRWELQELIAQPALRGKVILLLPPEEPSQRMARWQACFGDQEHVSKAAVPRTLAIRMLPDGAMVLITADDRSAAAYRMSLHLAEALVPTARTVRDLGDAVDVTELSAPNASFELLPRRRAGSQGPLGTNIRPRKVIVALAAVATALLAAIGAMVYKPHYNQADAHYNLGVLLNKKGDHEAAIAELRTALALKPDYAKAHLFLGLLLNDKGEHDAAIAELRQGLALKPDQAETHQYLGMLLNNKGDHDAAIAEFRKALALKPDLVESHYQLGIVLNQEGKHDAAITEFREVLALKPDYAEAHLFLGGLLNGKGERDAAITELRKALALKPDLAEAHLILGILLDGKGERDAAITELRKALALKPEQAEAHYYLGILLNDKREFQEAHRLDPTLNPPHN